MDTTALYYTLSTVSQTLAGALGMLAAFLALRVSALEGAIRNEISLIESRHGRSLNPNLLPSEGEIYQ